MINSMHIGNREFTIGNKTYIMGILNVTPDSFSDGGKHNTLEQAIQHVGRMIQDGADIIDIGGESTRPNYTMISEEEEMDRVLPVIEALHSTFDIPISIDTYKSKVAAAACKAGASLINDIWGLKYDPSMAAVVKEQNAAVCIMHNRKAIDYQDFWMDFHQDLQESMEIAAKAGIPKDKIMIDPGVGFAKTLEMNLAIVKHLERLQKYGYPVLLGTSRKSMIGLTLNESIENRVEGTLATSVLAVMKGCSFIRVHDVKENLRAIRMTEAILRTELN